MIMLVLLTTRIYFCYHIPMTTSHSESLRVALSHLSSSDPVLSSLIAKYPSPTFQPHTNYYQELVESIISQQLSVKAAATILKRFVDSFDHFPTPLEILERSDESLRACGLSGQKTKYIKDLAQHVIDGTVRFDHLDSLDNQSIIDELTRVKGIGVWTVHMFLIFCMGRLDILATGDLGIRMGAMRLYELASPPTHDELSSLAQTKGWHPYESVACWYIWQSLDNKSSS